ncbi:flagellar biosynthetic protein FliR [Brenneria rubrifaciens]|uniref:Flagellar biosynthetic protein FliR n=1 Tax=Brenneria rubrifaciens TaxID=55213 RepID=A0A4P8QM68_9GAMM|nr:flagellar biosynthetic protein FliR [Brenneria rubrifaciens]QCR08252.1 flagellar type III secretion system protein FliR [Brenneria rubrifaciens]
MLTFNSAEIVNWVNQFFWPFVRILALISTAPVFSERAIGNRVKIGLALLVTLLIAPYLPLNATPIFSAAGIWILIQQILIGVALGFSMQLAFAAIRMAGEFIGLQMGLAFATFFDPTGGPNMQVLSRFLNILAILLFLSFDGHLWLISLVADSFYTLPVSSNPINSHAFLALARAGGLIFLNGLMLALPIITILLIINLSLGLLNRVAPQLSIFVVGFPVTLSIGIMTVGFLIPLLAPFAERLFGEFFDLLADIVTQLPGA